MPGKYGRGKIWAGKFSAGKYCREDIAGEIWSGKTLSGTSRRGNIVGEISSGKSCREHLVGETCLDFVAPRPPADKVYGKMAFITNIMTTSVFLDEKFDKTCSRTKKKKTLGDFRSYFHLPLDLLLFF